MTFERINTVSTWNMTKIVLSSPLQFVNYWKGDSAPSPTDDQANSSGEQTIIEPGNQKVRIYVHVL